MHFLKDGMMLASLSLFGLASAFPGHQHAIKYVPRAQATPDSTVSALASFTPMPGAPAVAITKQSQVVSAYTPLYTLCPVNNQGMTPFVNAAVNASGIDAGALNATRAMRRAVGRVRGNGTVAGRVHAGVVSEAPSALLAGATSAQAQADGCTVYFEASATTVCATTLQGLATQVAVTACSQDVTFSTAMGFSLTSGAGGQPAVQTIVSNYIAPWQALTDGGIPDQVTERVCTVAAGATGGCVDSLQNWKVQTMASVGTVTDTIDFSTTISGPSMLTVADFSTSIPSKTAFSTSTQVARKTTGTVLSTVIQTVGGSSAAMAAGVTADNAVDAAATGVTTFQITSTSTSTITVFLADATLSSSSSLSMDAAAGAEETTTFTTTMHTTLTDYVTVTPSLAPSLPVEDVSSLAASSAMPSNTSSTAPSLPLVSAAGPFSNGTMHK